MNEILGEIGKEFIKNIADNVVGKILNNLKKAAIKLSLFIVFLLSSIIFAVQGTVQLLSKIHWMESGLGFIIFAIIFFMAAILLLRSTKNQ
ncbi:hypothetical protein JXM83_05805 [Candidatus Woesearchaeota archaeon]|nr:hypothetical protein [Candidatus Woesearchaeota archaeon]